MGIETDSTISIVRSAKRFFAGTVLSRISGLFREIAMAFCFGSSPMLAAFFVSYRLANLFRRLLGEGNLQSGFVPHFEALYAQDPKSALQFYRDVSFSLTAVLIAVVSALEIIFYFIGGIVDESWKDITHLAMWMVPGLIFICLYGLNSALLQCKRRYFTPAFAPVAFNLVWIGAAFFVRSISELAMGVTVGFIIQWLVTSLCLRKEIFSHLNMREWFQPKIFSESWKKLFKALGLGIIGVGAMQINSALDTIFARMADLSGPAYLWYAIRVQQLPLALFGVALSGALLPPLARAIQNKEQKRYQELLQGAIRQAITFMIPSTFALFALGKSGLSLLYYHGEFTEIALEKTLHCLWGYAGAVIPSVFVLLLAGGFYAKKNYLVPVIASVSAVFVNIVLNVVFVFVCKWGAASIAIATSASTWLNAAILSVILKKEIGSIHSLDLWGKLIVSSGVSALGVMMLGGHFFMQASLYVAGILGMSWLLKIEEFYLLLSTRKKSTEP